MLVEVEKAVGVGDDGEVKGKEMVAFARVCVTDEENFMNLFKTSSVLLEFLTVGGQEGEGGGIKCEFPTVEDSIVLRVSIWT